VHDYMTKCKISEFRILNHSKIQNSPMSTTSTTNKCTIIQYPFNHYGQPDLNKINKYFGHVNLDVFSTILKKDI